MGTTSSRAPRIGLVLGSAQPPGETIALARAAEQGGFDELWVGEDYFFTGGIATAGAALAHTTLPVGIGILPTTSRHPALLAMELATMAEIYPGRLTAGVGVGVPDWLEQMGIGPAKPLTALRNTIGAVRLLLDGGELTTANDDFVASGVRLEHAPAVPPALFLGVGGPKALRTAGAIADGAILSVLAGEEYVRWAAAAVAEGGAGEDFDLVAYTFVSMADDALEARERLRELFAIYLLAGPRNPMTEAHGIADEAAHLAALPFEEAVAKIPDAWIDDLAIVGDPDTCARKIRRLGEAGATAVSFCLVPGDDPEAEVARLAAELLPRVRGER